MALLEDDEVVRLEDDEVGRLADDEMVALADDEAVRLAGDEMAVLADDEACLWACPEAASEAAALNLRNRKDLFCDGYNKAFSSWATTANTTARIYTGRDTGPPSV